MKLNDPPTSQTWRFASLAVGSDVDHDPAMRSCGGSASGHSVLADLACAYVQDTRFF